MIGLLFHASLSLLVPRCSSYSETEWDIALFVESGVYQRALVKMKLLLPPAFPNDKQLPVSVAPGEGPGKEGEAATVEE